MIVIGLDEVGRGALAGPVAVGAVALSLPHEVFINVLLQEAKVPVLKDSKRLSASSRERIAQAPSLIGCSAVGWANVEEINEQGIVGAIRLAAGRALDQLKVSSEPIVRADAGLFHPYEDMFPTERFVKGDELYPEIALASIVAKVARDAYMRELATLYLGYGFERHVGYATRLHREAIGNLGVLPIHRTLFIRKIAPDVESV